MYRHYSWNSRRPRGGAIIVLLAVALLALMAATAYVFDLGRIVAAAQYAQRTADAAALAAISQPISGATGAASTRVTTIAAANAQVSPYSLSLATDGVTFYAAGQTVPGYRMLSGQEEAARVVVHAQVEYSFARVFNMTNVIVERSATAARVHAAGGSIAPMAVGDGTPLTPGALVELHESTAKNMVLAPGNYGWLDPEGTDFLTMLTGYNLPQSVVQANYTEVGDLVDGLTGEKVGQWEKALEDRLARASVPPYASQTWTEGGYTADNPRILIVPLVVTAGGSGTGAAYEVRQFGAFWLEGVLGGKDKSIQGRFMKYVLPLGDDAGYDIDTGLWTMRLVG